MNPDEEEIKYLQSQVRALEKKLRDRFHDIVRIMDLAQYEHSFSDPVFLELEKLYNDETNWSI